MWNAKSVRQADIGRVLVIATGRSAMCC